MREILFRAKSKNSGRWVYGDLITQKYKSRQGIHIYEKNDSFGYQFVRINKKTLGQYTGLKDKNGTKIFEGDVYIQGDKNIRYLVEYTEDCHFMGKQIGSSSWAGLSYWNDLIEVIGNIHDNPELLEKVGD